MEQRRAMTPDEIIRLRYKLDLTQAQFAERLGASLRSIGLWENAHVKPDKYRNEELWRIHDEQEPEA